MIQPIENLGAEPLVYNPQTSRYISQQFGGKWYLKQDTEYYGKIYPKGTEFNSIFGLQGHNGTDYAAPRGTPVLSVCDGFIAEQTKKETGYGNRLSVIDSKERVWIYGHCDDFATDLELDWNLNEKRYPVKEGQVIGFVGSSGFSTGPHLHLGVYQYKNGIKLNSDNGYGGALNPLTIIGEKEIMPRRFYIKDGAKIGVFVADGFALGGGFAKDAGALESLKSAFEFKGDEPTLELPPVQDT